MKIKVSQTNTPVWHDTTVIAELPHRLKALDIMSKNLWWVWNSEAKSLFRDINPDLWRSTGENPVMVLQRISSERLAEIQKDEVMMNRIETVYASFKDYMSKPMRKDVPSVSYFSMEYGLCNCLKIYSGGLGVLAGDYIKEASDSRVDMTAVGFLYRYGYFTQTLSVDGQQIANYEPQNFNQLPIEQMMDELAATLGGRVSEQLTFGEISTGALNDLERVTKQAYAMVVYYGMSDKLPNICYYDSTGQDYGFSKPYSDERARLIDEEVSRIIKEQYERAKEILKKHAEGHNELALSLIHI